MTTSDQQSEAAAKCSTEFVLNRKYGWYEGKVSSCTICLSVDRGTEECQTARKAFERYENALPELDCRLKSYAAEQLLEDANEWREDDGEPPVSKEEFAEMIHLTGLTFNNNGTADAFYDDAGIFAGHCIVVSMDADGKIKEAYIAG